MKKAIKTDSIKGYGGLDYITIEDVPLKDIGDGEYAYDVSPEVLELAIARHVLTNQIPIRGAEVHFLRKVLGKSLDHFAREFELSAAAILKWEKEPGKYIGRNNEVAVRLYVSQELKVDNPSVFKFLYSVSHQPEPQSIELGLFLGLMHTKEKELKALVRTPESSLRKPTTKSFTGRSKPLSRS
jgi:transcriptional regulator with XRE-family HTH domain